MFPFAEKFKDKSRVQSVVTDLDAILESPGYVRLHGKTHTIKPVLVEEFFAFANALAAIKQIEAAEQVTVSDLIEAYWGIINPVCPTITKNDIRDCTQAQLAALVQLVTDHTTGRLTEEKKKIMMSNQANQVAQA